MKYALLIYGDEAIWNTLSQPEMEKVYAEHGAYSEAMVAAGILRGGEELQPVSTAASVRFAGGATKTVDGPFAETKEQLAGFYLIEVDTIEQALEWAARMPGMTAGTVEVRPLGGGAPDPASAGA